MSRSVCRHYNGTVGGDKACCNAGIDYRRVVGGPDAGWVGRLPCIPFSDARQEPAHCGNYATRTDVEIAEQRREFEAAIERMEKVTPTIAYIKETYKGKSTSGTARCPACGEPKALRWSISGSRGHVHMNCMTPGCISFME